MPLNEKDFIERASTHLAAFPKLAKTLKLLGLPAFNSEDYFELYAKHYENWHSSSSNRRRTKSEAPKVFNTAGTQRSIDHDLAKYVAAVIGSAGLSHQTVDEASEITLALAERRQALRALAPAELLKKKELWEKQASDLFDEIYTAIVCLDHELFEDIAKCLALGKKEAANPTSEIAQSDRIKTWKSDGVRVPDITLEVYKILSRLIYGTDFVGTFLLVPKDLIERYLNATDFGCSHEASSSQKKEYRKSITKTLPKIGLATLKDIQLPQSTRERIDKSDDIRTEIREMITHEQWGFTGRSH